MNQHCSYQAMTLPLGQQEAQSWGITVQFLSPQCSALAAATVIKLRQVFLPFITHGCFSITIFHFFWLSNSLISIAHSPD